jgi:hypothetical protein
MRVVLGVAILAVVAAGAWWVTWRFLHARKLIRKRGTANRGGIVVPLASQNQDRASGSTVP